MKHTLLIAAALLLASFCYGQKSTTARDISINSDGNRDAAIQEIQQAEKDSVKRWKVSGILTFNVGATGLANWQAGGNSSFNILASANVNFRYHHNHLAWETNIYTEYGQAFVDNTIHRWQKTNDKFELSTKFGWAFARQWYLTALGQFRTQYANGFDYSKEDLRLLSNFLSPSYTDISIGIDWKPNEIFSVYISPLSGRITSCISKHVKYDDPVDVNGNPKYDLRNSYLGEEYVVDRLLRGKNSEYRADFGLSLKGQVQYTKVKNLKVFSAVTIFTPYSKKFGNFDIDWDVAVSYQFLKVLNVSAGTQFKYYDSVKWKTKAEDIAATQHVQFKVIFGFGLGYSF